MKSDLPSATTIDSLEPTDLMMKQINPIPRAKELKVFFINSWDGDTALVYSKLSNGDDEEYWDIIHTGSSKKMEEKGIESLPTKPSQSRTATNGMKMSSRIAPSENYKNRKQKGFPETNTEHLNLERCLQRASKELNGSDPIQVSICITNSESVGF